MWECPNCAESLDDAFAICWQCGTDQHGRRDSAFRLEVEEIRSTGSGTRQRRWQFSLRTLFYVCAAVGMMVSFVGAIPELFVLIAVGVFAANIFGYCVGLFVTYVLRLPNDGSLTWDSPENHAPSSPEDISEH